MLRRHQMDAKYFAISVQRGPTVVTKTIRQLDSSKTLGDVLETLGFGSEGAVTVKSAPTQDSRTDDYFTFTELTCPLHVVSEFGHRAIFFFLPSENENVLENQGTSEKKSALDVLMSSATSANKVIPERKNDIRAKDKVFNSLLDMMKADKLYFPNVKMGQKVLEDLAGVLFYMDSHHQKLKDRGIKMPGRFSDFQGFNTWKTNKTKESKVRHLG